jgi:hypothetical protein
MSSDNVRARFDGPLPIVCPRIFFFSFFKARVDNDVWLFVTLFFSQKYSVSLSLSLLQQIFIE